MPLRRMVPAFHVAGVFFNVSHQALDAVDRLQALPKLVEESKTMESKGVLQPLLKRARRSPVDLLQFGVEIGEPLFGSLVGRFLVGSLEPRSPSFLVSLRQMADDVPPLVPLTALNLSSVSEDLIDGLAQSFAPVDDAENTLLKGESSPQEVPQQLYDRFGPLSRRLRKPQNFLVTRFGHAYANDHLLAGNAFPMG